MPAISDVTSNTIPASYSADFATLSPDDWLASIRKSGWQEFTKLGFPVAQRGNELWKYTRLRSVAQTDFTLASGLDDSSSVLQDTLRAKIPTGDSWTTLAFVDGAYCPELSTIPQTEGLVATRIATTKADAQGNIKDTLSSLATVKNNPFAALNTAFLRDGAFVEVMPDAQIEAPIQLLFIVSSQAQDCSIYPRSLVICGENSKATLIETYLNLSDERNLIVPVLELFMAAGSSVRHLRVQNENPRSFHLAVERVEQCADSTFESSSFALGPAIGRYDIHTQLSEPNAECTIHGLYLTNGREHQSNEISTTHAVPRCKSSQFFKGVLSGTSRAVFSGKIVVAKDAQKTEANQKDLNLLLSRGAEIDTKPSLEIYADDVKCAHGATAGYLDEQTGFYMESRGLSKQVVWAMLIRGFVAEIVDEFEDVPELYQFISETTEETIPAMLATASMNDANGAAEMKMPGVL